MTDTPLPSPPRTPLPRAVWILGWVSLFTDVASELAHALLPLLLVGGMGASVLMLGVIEGLAEATAAFCKLFAGRLSDRLGRRKPLIVFGYALAALTKPLFPLAGAPWHVLAARLLDRVGKGVRGAPRDALLADVTPSAQRGEAYGLRQAMDTVGAVAGPLLAIALMLWLADARLALWFAVIPAAIGVLVLVLYLREPERRAGGGKAPLTLAGWRQLPATFWRVIAVVACVGLARFGEGFLIVLGSERGLGLRFAPLALVVMSAVYALAAWPVGRLADRMDRRLLLAASLLLLIAAEALLAIDLGALGFLAGTALWGLHLGFSQGLLAAMIADAAPVSLRGTAFGVFHAVGGVAALIASVLAGALWQWSGPLASYATGAALACAALILLGGSWRTLGAPAR
jgi:MFS family permease